jgi:hypothetical protein
MGLLDSDVDTNFVVLGSFGGPTPVSDGNARTPFEKAHNGGLPDEIPLEDVASLMVATWDNLCPQGEEYDSTLKRLHNYVNCGVLPVAREEDYEWTSPGLGAGTSSRKWKTKRYLVRATEVSKCLAQQKDPLLESKGLVAWLGSEIQDNVDNNGAKTTDLYSMTSWLKDCLPPVMDAVVATYKSAGLPLNKALPPFTKTDVINLLHDLKLLGDHEVTENFDSIRVTISPILQEQGFVFKEGHPKGSKGERQKLRERLCRDVESRLGQAGLDSLRTARA